MPTANVFVLCTGRCGSLTFAKACGHITNYTSGHETRCKRLGKDRLAYPPGHIEVDNRLSWFLGRLDETYGDQAHYVHLLRDRDETARSCNQRWVHGGIMDAYCCGILTRKQTHRLEICQDYCETVGENIRLFLKDKSRVMTVRLEQAKEDFTRFWSWIGADGDLVASLAEWETRHNKTPTEAKAKTPPTQPMPTIRVGFGSSA
jgi:hypothetical protein